MNFKLQIYSLYSGMRASLSITFTEPLSVVRESDRLTTTEGLEKEKMRPTKTKPKKKKYTWGPDSWSECSQPCGEGKMCCKLGLWQCKLIRS